MMILTYLLTCRLTGSLLPGALVNIKVRRILSDGLLVSFLTYFHGTVDLFHLSMVGPIPHVAQTNLVLQQTLSGLPGQ